MDRIILHIDVNNAFLSWTAVYMLKKGYKYDIRNRYAIIAGDESQRRGIVLAKSNPCKKKGVVTAEAIYSARRKCPYLDVYKGDFKVFRSTECGISGSKKVWSDYYLGQCFSNNGKWYASCFEESGYGNGCHGKYDYRIDGKCRN